MSKQAVRISMMLVLVGLGIAVLLCPEAVTHIRAPSNERLAAAYHLLRVMWCMPGGILAIVLGFLVGIIASHHTD
jgi:hypothetical protein